MTAAGQRGVGFLCHPTYCVICLAEVVSIPAPHVIHCTAGVASPHRLASARCNVFGDLVQVIDEA